MPSDPARRKARKQLRYQCSPGDARYTDYVWDVSVGVGLRRTAICGHTVPTPSVVRNSVVDNGPGLLHCYIIINIYRPSLFTALGGGFLEANSLHLKGESRNPYDAIHCGLLLESNSKGGSVCQWCHMRRRRVKAAYRVQIPESECIRSSARRRKSPAYG